ncbi:MAG: hypothetical protein KIT57_22920 [Blastocatellales bacterium]|nr:hypothetical protein [Blastocatellales bacterium]
MSGSVSPIRVFRVSLRRRVPAAMVLSALLVCTGCFVAEAPVEAGQITASRGEAANNQSASGSTPSAVWLNALRPVKFTSLTTEDGLSQNTVLCMLQDRQGFMWFGTQNGLNRFDGYSFNVYRHDAADPGSLRDNYVLSLYEDRGGVLWVGTNKGGLNRYDRRTEQFRAYVNIPDDAESLSLNAVTAIVEDEAGYLWVATDGQGVNRFDPRTGKFKRFINDPAGAENRRLNIVNDLYLDGAGTLWLGTSLGLSGMDLRNHEIRRYRHDPKDPQTLSHDRVQSIVEDREGALWVGTPGGLHRFDRSSGRMSRFQHDPVNSDTLAHNDVQRVFLDQGGRLWLATVNGLDRFDAETGRFIHHEFDPAFDPNARRGVRRQKVLALYEDRSGSLWAGVQDAGLVRYDARAKPFVNFAHDPRNPHSLGGGVVRAFFEDSSGRLLVSDSAGIYQLDRETGRFSPLRPVLPGELGGKIPSVSSLAEDREGRLWLAAGRGLLRLEGAAPHARFFPTEHVLHTICVARDGRIWAGTHGGGMLGFDPVTERITTYLKDPLDTQSLSDNLVYTIGEDREGMIWVGTNQGLNRFDPATRRFTRFLNDPQDPDSLGYNLVFSIREDRAGRLWIGTGGGLNLFDRKTERFRRYTEKDGLPSASIIGILEDSEGRLWLGTMKGLARFDPQTGACRNYDRTDGLFGNEVNQNAYYQNREGMFFFGGSGGFSAFLPEQILDDETPPPVVLTLCRRYNTDAAEGVALVEKGISARSVIEFSYKDNILTFEFAALSFRHPEKNQYAYQLAGYSDRWIQLGAKRDVTFTNLNAGDYTLHVRGSNGDGVWNTAGTSLRIRIIPPFWRRWWFVGLELLAMVGLGIGAYGWRIAALKRRHVQQQEFSRQLIESQEAERKRIASELHDSLGQNLLIVKNRLLLQSMTAPDEEARVQFQELTETVSNSLDEVRSISHDLRPPQLDLLGLRRALVSMIEKVDASSTIRFTYEIDECDDVFGAGDDITLYRIVQECLNNILKHSAATEARIELRIGDHQALLTIRDNGRGFTAENHAQAGLGLQGIAERARILGGTRTIHSAPGQGATVAVRIELKGK